VKEYGRFTYRPRAGKMREEEVVVGVSVHGVLSFSCPICGRRSALNHAKRVVRGVTLPGHKVTVTREGNVSVDRPILCPNGRCGWHVCFVRRGHKDVAEDAWERLEPEKLPPVRKRCRPRGAIKKRGEPVPMIPPKQEAFDYAEEAR
jgi:hypothetical protein